MIRLARVLLLPAAVGLVACTGARDPRPTLDDLAEEYVRLALAAGRHDENFVDAYYGPEHWQQEANSGEPVPLADLLARSRGLLERIRAAEPSDRRDFLEKQVVAAHARLRILSGESMTLAEECRLLFDVSARAYSTDELARARERLDALLPGPGALRERVERFRKEFEVPADRLGEVVKAILRATREWTSRHVSLPEGEALRVSFVQEKPWGAYNWYQGDLHSRIEVNTDLPGELLPVFLTLSHEGYPGHHTYNVLLEDRLVRGKGWMEFTVYPLFSPQSLLAEGTANVGLSVVASEDEQWRFVRETLAPLAGLDGRDLERYRAVLESLRPLRYARGEAARMLLEEAADEEEVVDYLVRYGLFSEDRARKSIEFTRTYRSYVFTYTAGKDLVEAYVGHGPDRVEKFFAVLETAVTPSRMAGESPAPS